MGGKKSGPTKNRPTTYENPKTPECISIKKEVEDNFYECEVCKKHFRQKSTFLLHCLIHKREQTFSCDVCKEEFPFLSRLQKHCLLEHSNDLLVVGQESDQADNKSAKLFRCDICYKGFLEHDALKKHFCGAHEKNNSGCIKEPLQSLNSPPNSNKRNPAVRNGGHNSKNDASPVRKQAETGSSAVLSIKMECDTSYKPNEVCNTLCEEDASSSDKSNQGVGECQDFSKNDLSPVHVKPDTSAELCIEIDSDSFDPKEACVTLWSEGSSSSDEESTDSDESYHVGPKKKFCCPTCNKKFVKKSYLQNHFRTHRPRPKIITQRFPNDNSFSSQTSSALSVSNVGPYICDICNKGFVKNADFQKHCLTHSEQNTYTCKVCSKQFARYGNFRAHCETHMTKSTFNCNICGTKFHLQKHLIDHQQMQSANANLQCEFCDKKFDQACSLIIHEQNHKGFHCDDCGSVFSAASALKRHQRSHANKSKCGVCAKAFPTNNSLRQHLETHFDSKMHFCDVCNVGFQLKHHLNIHRMTHQDDMPHTCQLCNEGFLHAWSLRNHLLEHEANQDEEMRQNCSLSDGENAKNAVSPGKVEIKKKSESYEENVKALIKKEKDC